MFFFTNASPTLIASRPRIVGATLKNFTTLIQFLPRRDVVDAIKLERFTLLFFTNASPTLFASRPRIVGATLKHFTTPIQFLLRRDWPMFFFQRQFAIDE